MTTIKNHTNNNKYLLTDDGLWVRDFTGSAYPFEINKLNSREDYELFIKNETNIVTSNIPEIGLEYLPNLPNICIVSDGYKFNEWSKDLYILPNNVHIIGVNRTLCKWAIDDNTPRRKMDFYLANNPYNECSGYLPEHSYRPKCICSIRTNSKFVKKYKGNLYYYIPTGDGKFGRRSNSFKQLDDYRNPICAAINLAFLCKVKKLLLVGCDDVFEQNRPASIPVNELFMYPQHQIAHNLIDSMLYWLTHQEDNPVEVKYFSYGPNLKNAEEADNILEFFK